MKRRLRTLVEEGEGLLELCRHITRERSAFFAYTGGSRDVTHQKSALHARAERV